MTRYVVEKAPCRVILTAPPSEPATIDPTSHDQGAPAEHPA